MTRSERDALLFTLATTKRHVCERQAKLRRVLRETARELERLDRQFDDIEQSETYLRGMCIMMSRKHYRDVATLVGKSLADTDTAGHEVIAVVARGLADLFKLDNPAFRYDTFFYACGLDAFGEVVR